MPRDAEQVEEAASRSLAGRRMDVARPLDGPVERRTRMLGSSAWQEHTVLAPDDIEVEHVAWALRLPAVHAVTVEVWDRDDCVQIEYRRVI